MKKLLSVVLCQLAVGLVMGAAPAAALTVTEEAKLLASDGDGGDEFGSSVAIDGNTAVVGAEWDWDIDLAAGSAYVFTRSAGLWTEQAKLVASDSRFDHLFGRSVAFDGDTAVIGAVGYDDYQGAAFVFIREDGVWTEQAKLLASDGWRGDRFGEAVAIEGDTVLVGTNYARTVYVFTRADETWTEHTTLSSEGGPDYKFGRRIALDGNSAIIGTHSDLAYVFTRDGGTWTQQATLQATDGLPAPGFGQSVAIDGNTVLIGAPMGGGGPPPPPIIGSAFVFTRTGSAWTQQARLQAFDGCPYDFFGLRLAVDGDTAVISRSGCPTSAEEPNVVHVFTRTGEVWAEQAKLLASDGTWYDLFNWSVALDGNTAIVGASNAYGSVSIPTGAAYVFRLIPPDADGDGVNDEVDVCLNTIIPESVPTRRLGVNRWALVDDDDVFDTTPPPGGGSGPEFEFTVADTRGCSCEQIIEEMELGWGHTKFGCSTGAMLQWVSQVWPPGTTSLQSESQSTSGGIMVPDLESTPSSASEGVTPTATGPRRHVSPVRRQAPRRGQSKK